MHAHRTIAETLPMMFLAAVEQHDGVALEHRDEEGSLSLTDYAALGRTVMGLARGLVAAGVRPGDRVAIFAKTRPEWLAADYAALCAGAIVVPIYHTSSADEVSHVLRHSGASLAFVEVGAPAERLAHAHPDCPELRRVVSLDGTGLYDLAAEGADVPEADVRARATAVRPDDVSTIVYTSGTTGAPKGCMLTHANYRSNTRMCAAAIDLGDAARIFIFLPFAHSMTRCTGQLAIEEGHTLVFYSGDPTGILPALERLRPTHVPSVPRLFEKVHAAATSSARLGTRRGALVDWAIAVGVQRRAAEAAGRADGPFARAKFAVADRLVLAKVRAVFGGRLELALTGAAPIDPAILRFFHACGILVLEGYGLTETAAATAANTPQDFRFGTVGRALAGAAVRLGPGGEVLVRGPHVFAGYYENPAATEAILRDGWLHSGDIGVLDEDGFLTIVGRIKDILITSSGKNVSPAVLENAMRQTPLIAQTVVVGDRRPHLVALVEVDPDAAVGLDPRALVATIAADLGRVNQRFARIEQVKRFAVLPRALSHNAHELTPTMKVRRAQVIANWAELVEELYAGTAGDVPSAADDQRPSPAPFQRLEDIEEPRASSPTEHLRSAP